MAQNDVLRLRFTFYNHQRVFGFTLNMRETSDVPDASTAIDAANSAANFFEQELQDVLASSVQLQSVYATRVLPGPAIPGVTQFANTSGTRPADALPPNSPFIFRLSSDDPGVKRAGRIYLSGVAKSDVVDGQLGASFLSTQVEALRVKLASGVNAGTWQGITGILRTINNGLPLTPPLFFPVTRVSSFPIIFSQRRRTTKRSAIVA